MELRLNKSPGLRNDLLITIPRSEIAQAHLHIAGRERLMSLPGLLRHAGKQALMSAAASTNAKSRLRIISALNQSGTGILDD